MENNIFTKKQIHSYLLNQVDEKINLIKGTMQQVQESLTSESKSTAGDKHETGRAMLHLEQEKNYIQLQILENQKKILININPKKKSKKIELGSLVSTHESYFYVAIGIGEIMIKNQTIYVISPSSPIGKLLLHKTNKHLPFQTKFGKFISFH